jgi:hypothetical protein
MVDEKYKVAWKRRATIKFASLYHVDHRRALRNTHLLLSIDPYRCANGVANFPNYPFNGYLWIMINNIIIVYRVRPKEKFVSIETCYSALTGEAAEIFFGILPNDDIDE